jgi:5-formyltetrahydrofolate cyclo-ligase
MDMGIGFGEILMIGALVLIFFGSKELPQFIRQLAKILARLRRYSERVRQEVNAVTRQFDLQETPPVDDMRERKKAMRQKYRQVLDALSPGQRAAHSASICEHLLKSPEFARAQAVMLYASMDTEVDTRDMMQKILASGKRLILPYCHLNQSGLGIAAVKDLSADLQKGTFDILEPAQALRGNFFKSDLHLVVCPGLAFDEFGRRLGRGKGYYDSFLKELKGKVPIIGVAFGCQIAQERVPFYYHDIAVDQVITEAGPLISPATDSAS